MDKLYTFRNRSSISGSENSPQFAYRIIYNKVNRSLTGILYNSFRKLIILDDSQKIYVDENLKDSWIKRLNNIKNIIIRSTCEGHDSKHISHIIFRPNIQNIEYIKDKVKLLNALPDTNSKYDIGNGGLYRIGIATRNWFRKNANNSKWEKWWDNSINSLEQIFNSEENQ
jgi:hypothetical protein